MSRMISVLMLSALLLAVAPSNAQADTVGGNWRGFTEISSGVFEIGLNFMVLFNYNSRDIPSPDGTADASVSTTNLSGTSGLSLRYFLARNWSLGAHLNGLFRYQSETTTLGDEDTSASATDVAFLGFLTTDYYIRLGNSFFFKPGVGVGGFIGSRSRPLDADGSLVQKASLSGVAVLVELGFVFYGSRNFNLKAGLDIIPLFGSSTPDDGEKESFVDIDAGFNVGFAYSF